MLEICCCLEIYIFFSLKMCTNDLIAFKQITKFCLIFIVHLTCNRQFCFRNQHYHFKLFRINCHIGCIIFCADFYLLNIISIVANGCLYVVAFQQRIIPPASTPNGVHSRRCWVSYSVSFSPSVIPLLLSHSISMFHSYLLECKPKEVENEERISNENQPEICVRLTHLIWIYLNLICM